MKNPAAVALGKMGGSAKSEAKAKASANNGAKGGRPINQPEASMKDKILSVIIHNSQGASDGTTGTPAEINRWLRGWSDPENLTATVTDENGTVVADKPTGRKTIKW